MKTITVNQLYFRSIALLSAIAAIVFLAGCGSRAGSAPMEAPPPPALPVYTVSEADATVYQEFASALEGTQDIEIRPQVDGYLDKIYVDEGAYVRKGQILFHINDRPFAEQLNNAKAGLAAAKASLNTADINLNKLKPLVENNIISPVQLRSAQSTYDAAVANVQQAEAQVRQAEVNLGFTSIKAPVEGYIGRIPHWVGSLVGMNTANALTVLSEIRDIYAYFSLSEADYLHFQQQFPGKTFEDKIKQMPAVELLMSDGQLYPYKGKIQLMAGQFDNSTGAVSLRAVFQNPDRLLRSGNTGKLRLPLTLKQAILVPQESTFAIQDKIFVFAVSDSNTVQSKPIVISGKSASYYFVGGGLKLGERIVYSGAGNLQDGMSVVPQPISSDSLLKSRPL